MDKIALPKGKNPQGKTGVVVSTKPNKTVIVAVTHNWRHPVYKKLMRRTKRFAVHNEDVSVGIGDQVAIAPTRPISKTKHYLIVKKLTAGRSA